MRLVYETDTKGIWSVMWPWLPYFLATDTALQETVYQKMSELFRGTEIEEDGADMISLMDINVIEIICEKYPIAGLREHLHSLSKVEVEKRDPEYAEEPCSNGRRSSSTLQKEG